MLAAKRHHPAGACRCRSCLRSAAWCRAAPRSPPPGRPVSTPPTVVALHLDQLSRCGPAGSALAARIRPALLAGGAPAPRSRGPAAAQAAFALMEHIGEFPPVHARVEARSDGSGFTCDPGRLRQGDAGTTSFPTTTSWRSAR